MLCPKNANTTITTNETVTACRAARRTRSGGRPPVSDRKIGTVPTGSMITNSVTKALVNTVASRMRSTLGRLGHGQRSRFDVRAPGARHEVHDVGQRADHRPVTGPAGELAGRLDLGA